MNKLAIALLIIVILLILFRLAIPWLSSNSVATGIVVDDTGSRNLGDCPGTPNCQSSSASRASQRVEPIAFKGDASTIIQKTAALLTDSTAGLTGVAVQTKHDGYLHATVRSGIMGYTDDVEILVDSEEQTLLVRSASRLGKSDLGANKKRVDLIRQMITAAEL